jgi:hypothetical protein
MRERLKPRTAYLRPRTFKPTIGMRPLHILGSRVRRSGKKRRVSDIMKSITAMKSWVVKKNKGASVAFRTHLLLRSRIKPVHSKEDAEYARHDHLELWFESQRDKDEGNIPRVPRRDKNILRRSEVSVECNGRIAENT